MAASHSHRGRKNLNLHIEYADPCQRLFNAIGVDSYIPPHRHFRGPKEETLIAVRGLFALVILDEVGGIKKFVNLEQKIFLLKV